MPEPVLKPLACFHCGQDVDAPGRWTLAIDGQAPMSTTLIVLDADTVRSEDGSLARRAAAATPVN